jgi:hypothetical protein
MLRAVLLDVRGTLWPNDLPQFTTPDPRLASLRLWRPDVDASEALAILRAALREEDGGSAQDKHGIIAAVLRRLRRHDADVLALGRALCVPASAGGADVSRRIRAAPAVASASRCGP